MGFPMVVSRATHGCGHSGSRLTRVMAGRDRKHRCRPRDRCGLRNAARAADRRVGRPAHRSRGEGRGITGVRHALCRGCGRAVPVYLGLTVAPALYQTLAMLGFAYAVLFLSECDRFDRSATAQVSRNVEEVARLGDRPTRAPGGGSPRDCPHLGSLPVRCSSLVTAMRTPSHLDASPTGFETLATEMWTFDDWVVPVRPRPMHSSWCCWRQSLRLPWPA